MLKVLGAQIKEFKKDSIMTPVFMILEVIMEMIIPLLMASIIDDGVNAGNMNHIYKVGAYMVVAAIIGLWAGMMGAKYGARASTGFARNLRKAMFENIQTFSFSNIDKYSTSSLITRLTTDVTNLQNAVTYGNESAGIHDYCDDYGFFHQCEAGKYLLNRSHIPGRMYRNDHSQSYEVFQTGI